MTCRKRIDDVETGGKSLTRDESGGCPDCGPGGIRHEGGVTLRQAFAWNVGTVTPMLDHFPFRMTVAGMAEIGGALGGSELLQPLANADCEGAERAWAWLSQKGL
jgi:hypothetical protein